MVWSGTTNCHNWKNYCQTPGESLLVKVQGRLGGEMLYFSQIVFGGFAVKVSNQGRLEGFMRGEMRRSFTFYIFRSLLASYSR